jgi:hypothetical protein
MDRQKILPALLLLVLVELKAFAASPIQERASGFSTRAGPIVLPDDPIIRVDLLSGEKSGPAEAAGR